MVGHTLAGSFSSPDMHESDDVSVAGDDDVTDGDSSSGCDDQGKFENFKEVQRQWQSEVIDQNLVFCASARAIEVVFIHATLHILLKGQVSVRELITNFVEGVVSLMTIMQPRQMYCIYVVTNTLHDAYILVYYWFPEIFLWWIPWELQGVTGLHLLHWMINKLVLLPFLFPEIKLIYVMESAYFGAMIILVLITLFKSHWQRLDMDDLFLGVGALVISACIAVVQRRHVHEGQLKRFHIGLRQKNVSARMFRILSYMVPHFAVRHMLKEPGVPIANNMECVSILFIQIAGFEKASHTLSPRALLDFLNEVFTELDGFCEERGVTKIETVGEEYVCAVGALPGEDGGKDGHGAAGRSKRLGKLLQVACDIIDYQRRNSVTFQMGIHTGPVVAGVVGQKLPRFRLFGDTVNTAARMMQQGPLGAVQFGEETRQYLPYWAIAEPRGYVDMKGKGQVMTYLLCRTIEISEDNYNHVLQRASSKVMPTQGLFQEIRRVMRGRQVPTVKVDEMHPAHVDEDDQDFLDEVVHDIETAGNHGWCEVTGCMKHDEEEEAFCRWFLINYACKSLVKKLNRLIAALLVVTFAELAYKFLHCHYQISEAAWYCVCRGLCCFILVASRVVLGQVELSHRNVRADLVILMALRCIFVTLMICSYSYILQPHAERASTNEFAFHGLTDDVIAPVAIVVCAYLMSAQQFMFSQSCITVLIPVFLSLAVERLLIEKVVVVDKWFAVYALVAVSRSYLWEVNLRKEFTSRQCMNLTYERIEGILESMMPPKVVEELHRFSGEAGLPSHPYRHATVLQCDLCGFTKLASTLPAQKVVLMVSTLFARFDNLADIFETYKVETVGDAYIAAQAESPLTCKNSPIDVVKFGLGMILATHDWSKENGTTVSCRVGIHTGECIGGVVGTSMQRYHLFGHMMTVVEILESTAPEGRVQLSSACRDAVVDHCKEEGIQSNLLFERRTDHVLTTSKHIEHAYSEVGGATFLVQA